MAHQYIHDITIGTGLTPVAVLAEFPHEAVELDGKIYALGRKSEMAVRAWAARHAANRYIARTGRKPAVGQPGAPITHRQAQYIMGAIRRGLHECGFEFGEAPTHDELLAWDRLTASAYIDFPKNNC